MTQKDQVAEPRRSITRYKAVDAVKLILAGRVKLQKHHEGHAKMLGGKSGSEELGWLTRQQVEVVESLLSKPCQTSNK